jgi:hypothetical protein
VKKHIRGSIAGTLLAASAPAEERAKPSEAAVRKIEWKMRAAFM